MGCQTFRDPGFTGLADCDPPCCCLARSARGRGRATSSRSLDSTTGDPNRIPAGQWPLLGHAHPSDLLTAGPRQGRALLADATAPHRCRSHPAAPGRPDQAGLRRCLQRLWRVLRKRALPPGHLALPPAPRPVCRTAVVCRRTALPLRRPRRPHALGAVRAAAVAASLDRCRAGLRLHPRTRVIHAPRRRRKPGQDAVSAQRLTGAAGGPVRQGTRAAGAQSGPPPAPRP